MEYILTESEFAGLMPKSDHTRKVKELQKQIDDLHRVIYPYTLCKGDFDKYYSYCDDCVLNYMGTRTCPKENKRYSK